VLEEADNPRMGHGIKGRHGRLPISGMFRVG
jgi:hypothetical protein